MANELSALIDLAGSSIDDLVITPAESLHLAIVRRTCAFLGPAGPPAFAIQRRATATTYGAVRQGVRAAAQVGARTAMAATGRDLKVLTGSRRGRAANSALNALAGDLLAERSSALAIPMGVTANGEAVACEPDALRSAYPRATSRIAVFIHGLGEIPESWQRRRRPTFGAQLLRDFGITAIYVEYNTGFHIAENGARLSELLDSLVRKWPVRPTQLVLVGHSMGGLVARSACHAGIASRRPWVTKTTHLFALGSPHMGVPLEKFVHAAAAALRSIPESRPIADILDRRSAGIRDLREGYVADGDVGCVQTFIGASRFDNAAGWLAGDLLVRTESATGRRRDGSVLVSSDHVFHLPKLTHFDLLDHPLVYKTIRDVIAA